MISKTTLSSSIFAAAYGASLNPWQHMYSSRHNEAHENGLHVMSQVGGITDDLAQVAGITDDLAQVAGITDDLAQISSVQSVTMGLAQTAGITDDLA